MRAVDTNLLVRLVVRDDARQTALAEEFIRGGAWVSHLALAELTWVLDSVYELEPAGIATVLEMLLQHRELSVQDTEVAAKALAQYRRKPALGYSDCLLVEIARKAGHLPLGTFDRDLARLADVERV